MKVTAKGDICISISEPTGSEIDVQDEGVNLGLVTTLNFVGDSVMVSKTENTATITFTGSGFTITDYTGFEAGGGTFPSPVLNKVYRLVFSNPGTPVTKGGATYENNMLIMYIGSGNWLSWSANVGSDS